MFSREEYNQLLEKIKFSGEWLDSNPHHPKIEEAFLRYRQFCCQLSFMIKDLDLNTIEILNGFNNYEQKEIL